jgi:hypothetical protein
VLGDVPAYALSIPVLDGGEHPYPSVVKREHLRAVYITGYEVMNPVTIKAQTSGGHCR